jgi:hypothetical protein
MLVSLARNMVGVMATADLINESFKQSNRLHMFKGGPLI